MKSVAQKYKRKTFLLSLAIAMLIHAVLLFKSLDLSPTSLREIVFEEDAPEKIKLTLIERREKERQVVQTQQRREDQKEPEDTKYLSETNQNFERETIASQTGTFQDAGQGSRDATDDVASIPQQQEEVSKQEVEAIAETSKSPGDLSWEALSQATEMEPTEMVEEESPFAVAQGIETGLEGHVGFAQNNDFVEDVPLGDLTNLNTVEFKYYSFYHRIRQQLEQYWGSTLQEKARQLYAQGRRLPASTNMITSLEIVLDENGSIIEIHVKSPSGIQEFDEAAIESFGKAGPFPNPPKGMVQNGRAILTWGFVVKG